MIKRVCLYPSKIDNLAVFIIKLLMLTESWYDFLASASLGMRSARLSEFVRLTFSYYYYYYYYYWLVVFFGFYYYYYYYWLVVVVFLVLLLLLLLLVSAL